MSSDYDIRIKSLFDQAKNEQPDPAFTRQLMGRIRRQERRARLLWLATLLIAIPLLWTITPDLEALLVSINGFMDFSSDYTLNLLTDAGRSPVTWIFLAPPLAYYLYLNRHRFI
jgi:hypothetical protein